MRVLHETDSNGSGDSKHIQPARSDLGFVHALDLGVPDDVHSNVVNYDDALNRYTHDASNRIQNHRKDGAAPTITRPAYFEISVMTH